MTASYIPVNSSLKDILVAPEETKMEPLGDIVMYFRTEKITSVILLPPELKGKDVI